MFCTKCGHPVAPGASFCPNCGNALTGGTPQQPTPAAHEPDGAEQQARQPAYTAPREFFQGYYMPQAPPSPAYTAQPVKKKTGLIVGLCVGGAALLAIVALLLFVWPGFLKSGAPVAGTWYSENRGEAIRFGSGSSFDAYTYYGDFDGDYQYDKAKGEGRIEMSDGQDFDFVVEQDVLYVENMGSFTRADGGFDLDDFIDNAREDFGTAD